MPVTCSSPGTAASTRANVARSQEVISAPDMASGNTSSWS